VKIVYASKLEVHVKNSAVVEDIAKTSTLDAIVRIDVIPIALV